MAKRQAPLYLLSWLLLFTSADAEVAPLSLPLRFVRDLPVTSIEIAGQRVEVIVDTGGAQGLTLDPEILNAAHATASGQSVATLDVFGTTREQARFRVPEVTVAGRTFENLDALAAAPDSGAPIPNVLGRKFLSQFLVIIDYPGRTLSLAAPGSRNRDAAGCYGTRIPFAEDDGTGLVITTALTDAGRLKLLWDSGAARSQLPARTAREYHLHALNDPSGGASYTTRSLRLNDTDFGPTSFIITPITLPNRIEGVLGHDFLAERVVCIDYQRREVWVH